MAGLAAYLVLILAPALALRRVERETRDGEPSSERRNLYVLSVAVQAALVGYAVCSFFASIQYLWYLYYVVAYAIALRRIHAASVADVEPEAAPARGVLWALARGRRAGLPAGAVVR